MRKQASIKWQNCHRIKSRYCCNRDGFWVKFTANLFSQLRLPEDRCKRAKFLFRPADFVPMSKGVAFVRVLMLQIMCALLSRKLVRLSKFVCIFSPAALPSQANGPIASSRSSKYIFTKLPSHHSWYWLIRKCTLLLRSSVKLWSPVEVLCCIN